MTESDNRPIGEIEFWIGRNLNLELSAVESVLWAKGWTVEETIQLLTALRAVASLLVGDL